MNRSLFASVTALPLALLLSTGCGSVTTENPTGSEGGSAGSGTGAQAGTGGTTTPTCTPSEELCDGMDNNCDGNVDEDCPCVQGQTKACYSGPAGTQDVGACKTGEMTCDEHGVYGPCTGEVLPASGEECNTVDDDCNGMVDDMGMTMCGVGACNKSVLVCENGTMNSCMPGQPSAELCDGIDNNCNQLTDEAFPNKDKPCDSGLLGECKAGVFQCLTQNGVTAEKCVANKMPGTEACDGLDNDCDGKLDDNVPGTGSSCSTGLLGPCSQGTISCQNNTVDCFPNNPPSNETCDLVDNDCNGVVDDPPGVNMPCDTGLLGACKDGIMKCNGGVFGCVQSVQAQATDVCGDNIDNDCNGSVDPGCLYIFSGIQTNLPIANLNGWQQCYLDTYATTGVTLNSILTTCNKAKLLLGCRATGSTTLLVAAYAPRLDVTFDTGTGNVPHDANNVGWYYNGSWSWGFAQQGDVITRNSCDTASTNPDKRLCWHTGGQSINGGWRCGINTGLNASAAFQRLVYHAD